MQTHNKHKTLRIKTSGYGTSDIAVMCNVTPATVARWIDDGKMPSYLTAGGHRRVNESDLTAFMQSLNIPFPQQLALEDSTHVLIVDDDAADRQHIVFLINKHFPSAKILEAENGFDMGNQVGTFHPALIVLDLYLPGIDGFAVCEQIRKDPKLNQVKILAVSGQADLKTRQRIMKQGADDFLSKNADDQEWIDKLKKWLPTRRMPTNVKNRNLK